MNPADLATTHLHRATRTSTLHWLRGREALIADDLATLVALAGGSVSALAVVEALRVTGFQTEAGTWRRHCWSRYEADRVVAETVVEDTASRLAALGVDVGAAAEQLASACPLPLGELRAGAGQQAAGPYALLPPGIDPAARPVCDFLHRLWNGRDMALAGWSPAVSWRGPDGLAGERQALRAWVLGLLVQLPDAVLMFEAAAVGGDKIAVLWRLHGHHHVDALGLPASGRRIRLIGSSLVNMVDGAIVEDDTVIDTVAFMAQALAPTLAY